MNYKAELHLKPELMPRLLKKRLKGSMPVDFPVKVCQRHKAQVMLLMIEASTSEDLEAKLTAFMHMIEAAGYGHGQTNEVI